MAYCDNAPGAEIVGFDLFTVGPADLDSWQYVEVAQAEVQSRWPLAAGAQTVQFA